MTPQRNPQVVGDEETRSLWALSESVETFLHELRVRGAAKIECIRTLHLLTGSSLGEAKEIVHLSAAWADHRTGDDAFHDAAFTAWSGCGARTRITHRSASQVSQRIAS